MTLYRFTKTYEGKSYTTDSRKSEEDAIIANHVRAYNDGMWKPRELRRRWWQLWKPKRHDYIEQGVIKAIGSPASSEE